MRSLKRQRGFLGVAGVIAPVLGVGASIYGAQQQADAANTASSIQQQEFQTITGQLQPFLQSGTASLGQINAGLAPGGQFNHMFGLQDFQQSPAYQFNLQQGQQAIDKAANARGNLYAPQTLKDLGTFTQGMASNEFNNAFNQYQTGVGNIWNRLYNTAGAGQNAAAQLGGFGTTTAGQIGENVIGAGNARAAGTVGAANAFTGGINQYANMAMINQLLAGQQGSGLPPSAINNIYGFGASPEF